MTLGSPVFELFGNTARFLYAACIRTVGVDKRCLVFVQFYHTKVQFISLLYLDSCGISKIIRTLLYNFITKYLFTLY